jgi:hypothetical protein
MSKDGGDVKRWVLAGTDYVYPRTTNKILRAFLKSKGVDEKDIDAIEAARVQSLKIRSVLTCETKTGVCAACYGRDLARGTPVNIGEAVGVIADAVVGTVA